MQDINQLILLLNEEVTYEVEEAFSFYEHIDEEELETIEETYQELMEKQKEAIAAHEAAADYPEKAKDKETLETIAQYMELYRLRKEYFQQHLGEITSKEYADMLADTRLAAIKGEAEERELGWVGYYEPKVTTFKYKDLCYVDMVESRAADEESLEYEYRADLTVGEKELLVNKKHYVDAFVYVDIPRHNKVIKKVWICGLETNGTIGDLAFMQGHVRPILEEKLPEILEKEFGIKQ